MSSPVIACQGITSGYDGLAAIRDVTIEVCPGEIVCLFGPNGAGKTTTLLALTGELPLTSGSVSWNNESLKRPRLQNLAKAGLAWVPDGRGIFMTMTVRDNLRLGRGSVSDAVGIFPELGPLLARRAGLLSGGEQQMLALARALAARPRVLLLDELSLGLAPVIVERLYDTLRSVTAESDIGVLLVEQQARRALDIVDRWYLLRSGQMVAKGEGRQSDGLLESLYLVPAADQPPASQNGSPPPEERR